MSTNATTQRKAKRKKSESKQAPVNKKSRSVSEGKLIIAIFFFSQSIGLEAGVCDISVPKVDSALLVEQAVAHLNAVDQRFEAIFEQHADGVRKSFKCNTDLHAALIRSIVYQQLSGSAANAIFGRFFCNVQRFPH